MLKEPAAVASSGNGSASTPAEQEAPVKEPASAATTIAGPQEAEPAPKPVPWPTFLENAKTSAIKDRFATEVGGILKRHNLDNRCVLALFEPEDNIDSFDLDQIFGALSETNADRSKDVLLLLLSRGGSIEAAYQISKLCRSFANKRFIAVVPRYAKSAATLIAIGADEIHIGPLGELGPIDPQLGGLPALGVSQALQTIAAVSQRYPGSAEMFARYLRLALTVEQIGYCDRISESAVQYAVRLLSTKPKLPRQKAEVAARELVHEYKDHGFVIDLEEAQMHPGADWITTGTPELAAAEEIYSHFDTVNWFLGQRPHKRRLLMTGGAAMPTSVMVFTVRDD
jgi:hypothetical protein